MSFTCQAKGTLEAPLCEYDVYYRATSSVHVKPVWLCAKFVSQALVCTVVVVVVELHLASVNVDRLQLQPASGNSSSRRTSSKQLVSRNS